MKQLESREDIRRIRSGTRGSVARANGVFLDHICLLVLSMSDLNCETLVR